MSDVIIYGGLGRLVKMSSTSPAPIEEIAELLSLALSRIQALKASELTPRLTRSPFFPLLGPFEPSGRRHTVDMARRQLAAIRCQDGYLIG